MTKSYEKRIDWQRIYHKSQRSNGKKRSLILDELCDLTGMNRKYLIRKLNKKKVRLPKRREAKLTFHPEIYLPIIKPIWLAANQICGKRLKVVLQDWLHFYEEEFGKLGEAIKLKVLQISSDAYAEHGISEVMSSFVLCRVHNIDRMPPIIPPSID